MNKKGGGSAFPLYCPQIDGVMQESVISGMTLHQYYAGKALMGMVSAKMHHDRGGDGILKVSRISLKFADAMIKAYEERSKSEDNQ